jgi:biopolymer transport protein ExbD
MNLRPGYRKEDSVDVNLTPLIDVVFLLLIFFMVSTTFDKYSKLKVTLPESSASVQQQQQDSVNITIDARGRYFVNERQLVNTTAETLKLALNKTIAGNKEMPVVLRADANTPHHAVVTAMDVISQLGLSKLSIATVKKQ